MVYVKSSSAGFNAYYLDSYPLNPPDSITYSMAGGGTYINSFYGSSGQTHTENMPTSFVQTINNIVTSSSSNRIVYMGITAANEYTNVSATSFSSMSLTIYYHKAVSFTIKNNFDAGSLKVNSVDKVSGSPVNTYEQTTNTLEAIEPQSNGGINYLWNDTEGPSNKSNWDRKKGTTYINKGSTQSISPTAVYDDDGTDFIANMRPYYNITFQNSGRSITANGTQGTSSVTIPVVEQNTVTVSTDNSYDDGGVTMTFSKWLKNGQSYSSPISPTETGTYTAKYKGVPDYYHLATHLSITVGQPITVYWTDYNNSGVIRYDIWRKIKLQDGSFTTPSLLATINPGSGSYIDYDYVVSNLNNVFLAYQVKAYFSPDTTYSGDAWVTTYAEVNQLISHSKNESVSTSKEIPKDYSIANYPNPFNPTTTINYQLPVDGMVTLKVYDILGKEVATLVNENRQAGYYNAVFDAGKLTSGIYIYTIHVNGYVQSKKMLLMK